MARTALLAAGGTGGHLFPAQALADELRRRGWTVHLAVDERADRFAGDFPGEVHIVPSATIGSKNPVALLKTFLTLGRGYRRAKEVIRTIEPHVVVGFGGYPTLPPLTAARSAGVPRVLHEQNAVMGRANRLLAKRVDAVATGFPLVSKAPVETTVTGNPLRLLAHDAAKSAYPALAESGDFALTVFGGSQGARYFADTVPEALVHLAEGQRKRLVLTMQARAEDIERVEAALDRLGVRGEVKDFFGDMPARIAASHLVICRSGASSVAELSLIGRPSVLVPFPGALDDDQGHNAAVLEEAGGAVLRRQRDLGAKALGALIGELMDNAGRLSEMAASAKSAGIDDASARLADLVERVAKPA